MPVVNLFFCHSFSYHCYFNKRKQIPTTSNEMAFFSVCTKLVIENKSHESFSTFPLLFPTIFLFQLISTYILFIQSKLSFPSVTFHSTPLFLLYFFILSPYLLQFFSINSHQQPYHHLLPSTFPYIVSLYT